MNKKEKIIGLIAVVALVLGLIAFNKPVQRLLETKVIEKEYGSNPDVPYPYISVGGVRMEYRNSSFVSATSTGISGKGGSIPCLFQSPSATSTGVVWMNIPTSGATTTPITWVIATSSPVRGFATTSSSVAALVSRIGTTTTAASYGGHFKWTPTKDDQNIFAPDTWVLFSAVSSKADASTGSIGTIAGNCGGEFQVMAY